MQRVTDLADPRRCKGASVDGQCQNVAEEGSDYCRVHGGKDQAPARRLKQYLLTKAQDRERLAQFAENDALKTLREEVVVALGQLERRLSLANRSDAEFLAAYPEVEKSLKLLAESEEIQFLPGTKVRRNAFAGAGFRARPANHRDHRGRVGGHPGLRADRREHHHANPGDGPTHRQL